MTYFTFLFIFLVLPIGVLSVLNWRTNAMKGFPISPLWIIGLHVVIAVIWTTPWDNYLVATSVWWYDPNLVNGAVIGYVPIEEYTFFVLQPIFTGLWLLYLMQIFSANVPHVEAQHVVPLQFTSINLYATLLLAVIWLISAGLLLFNIAPATYLGLEVIWALPPLMLQFAFGADILRRQWRLVVFTILSATIYLSLADTLAIQAGTWTISPTQSTGVLLGGILPIEELIFFFLTNSLIVCGVTLALSPSSIRRLRTMAISRNTSG